VPPTFTRLATEGGPTLPFVRQRHCLSDQQPLIALFQAISDEQGWNPGNQLQAYPRNSAYFGLFALGENGEETLIGGLQLVTGNGDEGLPVLTVWPELGLWGNPHVADIALLALSREHRGRPELFWLLCVEMWRYCRGHEITDLWVEVTPAKLALYRRLGWPLRIAGELRLHWGEACHPCTMTTEEVRQALETKARTSATYRRYLELADR